MLLQSCLLSHHCSSIAQGDLLSETLCEILIVLSVLTSRFTSDFFISPSTHILTLDISDRIQGVENELCMYNFSSHLHMDTDVSFLFFSN
jgi:hypothetical protein